MGEPRIKTSIPHQLINGHRLRYTSPDGSVRDVDAMLLVWPKEDGLIAVEVSEPARPNEGTIHQYEQYGHLTQEEFERIFPVQ
jgi:hypothetical protein